MRTEQRALAARLPDHAGVHDRAGLDGLERVDLHAGRHVAVRLDHALVPDDRALLDPGLAHHVGVLADHATAERGAAAYVHVVMHDGPVQERAFLDDDVAADDGELPQLRPGLDLGVVADAERPRQHRLRIDLRAVGDPDARRHLEPVNVHADLAGQYVGLSLEIALVRADILPVAVGDPAV